MKGIWMRLGYEVCIPGGCFRWRARLDKWDWFRKRAMVCLSMCFLEGGKTKAVGDTGVVVGTGS